LAYAGDGPISHADSEILKKIALHSRASLVIVTSNTDLPSDLVVVSKNQFFGRLGGIVSSVVPLEPEYGSQLVILAKNKLPPGLVGKADDLFEAYVHAGLQFLLRGRVIRYGQNRRFEVVPDGLVLGSNAPLMLYDAKAASEAYEFSRTAIRQFSDYARHFQNRYEQYVGRLHAFVVISDSFQDQTALMDRSNELYAECSVPLVCFTARGLAETVSLFADSIAFRAIVDWKTIFAPPLLRIEMVREAIEARRRDRIARG